MDYHFYTRTQTLVYCTHLDPPVPSWQWLVPSQTFPIFLSFISFYNATYRHHESFIHKLNKEQESMIVALTISHTPIALELGQAKSIKGVRIDYSVQSIKNIRQSRALGMESRELLEQLIVSLNQRAKEGIIKDKMNLGSSLPLPWTPLGQSYPRPHKMNFVASQLIRRLVLPPGYPKRTDQVALPLFFSQSRRRHLWPPGWATPRLAHASLQLGDGRIR